MRLALLSDIHGNTIALDAVLTDIASRGGVDAYWVLGDLVALGPDPVGVLERLSPLPNGVFVRGNTDRYVVSGDRPPPTFDDVRRDLDRLPTLVDVAATFAWTQGMVTAAGWLDWLAALPLEVRLTLPDGTRLLGVHAAPGSDDGAGLKPEHGDAEMTERLDGCGADLIGVGHTHRHMDRRVGAWHVVNLGSVSLPPPGEARASYVLLEATRSGHALEHRLVDYDHHAVVAALGQVKHPVAGWISGHFHQVR